MSSRDMLMVHMCGWRELQQPTSKQGWHVCLSLGEVGGRLSRRGCRAGNNGGRGRCLTWMSIYALGAETPSEGWVAPNGEVPHGLEAGALAGKVAAAYNCKGGCLTCLSGCTQGAQAFHRCWACSELEAVPALGAMQ